MIEPRLFVILITILFGVGFFWPIVHKPRNQGDNLLPLAVHLALVWAFMGSLVGIAAAIPFLFQSAPAVTQPLLTSSWVSDLPPLTWEVRLDGLSAFFVLLIASFSVVVAIYSLGALRAPHYKEQAPRIASAFNLFVWATLLVVVANDAFSLIIGLEIMTLAFGYLALYKHKLYLGDKHNLHLYNAERQAAKKKNAGLAPQIYLIVSHTGTAFLLVALVLLAIRVNSLSFDALRADPLPGNTTLATVVFLVTLAGLGIRAGLVPAHFWVPLVHPASPTTTHALSLGIAIKVAVYLMYRFFFQFMQPETWWGYVLLLIAAFTSLVNVWYAIASHDLKEALAYHSIENIGIMTAGIGAALIYAPEQTDISRWITALALVASLYHLLNHAAFKGLLYLCVGAIDNLTGQVVEFDKLGGLIKLFPWTSTMFLVGAAAISGFPPLNGYVSRWLTLQALLNGISAFQTSPFPSVIVIVLSLMLLAASFALTAFCFYKIIGLSLLGLPRSSEEDRQRWQNREGTAVPWTMGGVMGVLALLCLLLGIFPAVVIDKLLSGVVGAILDTEVSLTTLSWVGLQFNPPLAAPESLAVPQLQVLSWLALGCVLALVTILSLRFLGRRKQIIRPEMPWNCGTPYAPARMQYTSAALSFLIRDRLNPIPGSFGRGVKDYLPAHLKLSHSGSYPQVVIEFFRVSYNRLIGWVQNRAERTGDAVQNGDVRQYLGYIFVADVTILVLFLLLGG